MFKDIRKLNISVTDSKSLYLIFDLLNGRTIHLEMFYGSKKKRMAFSVYENKKLVARDIGKPAEILKELKSYG